ncbi:glycosyl hydrolase family 7-domain-containing protein [Dichomitus squalens]|uniref:Glucanase n=1 Tax=Dichomitus squalens TaxID=114155 RepID=A0A4V2K6X3_9APHY|nr:glycosyl hydrolase family 7-domain-containing protein [Dichomitus squalens]
MICITLGSGPVSQCSRHHDERELALTLKFITNGPYSTNIGSRVYLMDMAYSKYELLNLKNQEFTFYVDVSQLPCSLNSALYFAEMDADGGNSRFSTNKAGVKYGTPGVHMTSNFATASNVRTDAAAEYYLEGSNWRYDAIPHRALFL